MEKIKNFKQTNTGRLFSLFFGGGKFTALLCAILLTLAAGNLRAATFTATNTNDSGPGSLRQAILDANASPGTDNINVTVNNGTINLLTSLPAVTDTAIIINTQVGGDRVELNGTATQPTLSSIGFDIQAPNCQIRGFAINRFGDAGIRVGIGGDGTIIVQNYIGTNKAGDSANCPDAANPCGNLNRGIWVSGAQNVQIGTSGGSGLPNTIAGNLGRGISISGTNIGNVFYNASAIVKNNFIGTTSGNNDVGNTQDGILISGGSGSQIGGAETISNDTNIIVGNNGNGINIASDVNFPSSNNVIQGNYIGFALGSGAAVPNNGSGIIIQGANNMIGGITADARNVITGNAANGISINSSLATGNIVVGNNIGVDRLGTVALGNGLNGIQIANGASNNNIGGTGNAVGQCVGTCNIIANNGAASSQTSRAGVYIDQTAGRANAVRGNSIYTNGTTTNIGIDLGAPGATANDSGDADSGANDLQNYPVLSSANTNGVIAGTLSSTANTVYAIDFYRNTSTDGTASEARTYIGSGNVTTDGSGNAAFSIVTGVTLTAGEFVTATATVVSSSANSLTVGDTSEISAAQAVVAAPAAVSISGTITKNSAPLAGVTVTLTGTATGTTTTNSSGQYSFGGLPSGGNYTVTPSLANNIFTPPDRTYNNLTTNVTNADFVAMNAGLESDVTTRPSGDGAVDSTDVTQVRRFAVGFDAFNNSTNEFQRADSSPLSSFGDGQVDSTDVIQARRYAIGSDAMQTAQGPTAPGGFIDHTNSKTDIRTRNSLLPRIVRVVNNTANPGQTVVVSVNVDAEGDEANYGFSLNYNTSILSNPVVAIGTAGGNVLANTCNPSPTCSPGMIGFSVDFGGGTIAAGNNRQLVTITFNVASNAPAGDTPVTFGDTPAIRKTSNTSAQALATTYNNGVVTISAGTRNLAVGNQTATAGQTVTVPILADTVGDERGFTFSLNYNTANLSNPVVALGSGATGATLVANTCNPSPTCSPGMIGFSIDFPTTIAAGTDLQLVTITFNVAAGAAIGQTPLTFGDTPAIRRTSSATGTALPTTYTNGFVNILAMARNLRVNSTTANPGQTVTVTILADAIGDEANYGFSLDYNTAVLSNPVVTIGTAGGNVLANTCNPSPTCSPGMIGFSVDFGGGTIAAGNNQQLVRITFNVAGNAPAGDTPLTFTNRPAIRKTSNTSAQALPTSYVNGVVTIGTLPRTIRVNNVSTSAGQTVTVNLLVDAVGDEANYGFSLNYNTAILSNPVVAIGTAGGNVLANTCNPAPTCSPGMIGFSVDFGGGTIAAGANQQLVRITFNVASNAPAGDTPVTFGDTPAIRKTSNTGAQALPTSYVNGVVTILGPLAAEVQISGRILNQTGNGVSKARVTLTNSEGETRTVLTNSFGYYNFTEVPIGTYIISVSSKNYRFSPRIVNASEDLSEVDFFAESN